MRAILTICFICLVASSTQVSAEYPTADEVVKNLGIRESKIASRDMPGWARPNKVTIMIYEEMPASGPESKEW